MLLKFAVFGAWFVLTLFVTRMCIFPLPQKLRHLPSSLEETSRVLGRSPLKTFQHVVYPQISSVLYAGTLLVFLYTISDFGAVQLLRYDTLTRSIATAQLANKSLALALGLFLLVIAGVVVFAERMVSRKTISAGQSEIGPPLEYSLGGWRIPAVALVSFITLLSLGAPLFTLGKWAFDGIRRGSGNSQPLTLDGGQIWESTWNTLSISVIAGLAAIIAFCLSPFLSHDLEVRSERSLTSLLLPRLPWLFPLIDVINCNAFGHCKQIGHTTCLITQRRCWYFPMLFVLGLWRWVLFYYQ